MFEGPVWRRELAIGCEGGCGLNPSSGLVSSGIGFLARWSLSCNVKLRVWTSWKPILGPDPFSSSKLPNLGHAMGTLVSPSVKWENDNYPLGY